MKHYVLQLQSKLTYAYLGVLENGNIGYIGIGGDALNCDKCKLINFILAILISVSYDTVVSHIVVGRFKVLPGATVGSFKLQNVAYPNKYLTIRSQYCVGYVSNNSNH